MQAVVVALAVAALVVWAPVPERHPLVVAETLDGGTLLQPRDWLRDGGQSALVGSRILWVFGDTLFPTPAADGSHLRSSSSAWSDPSTPRLLHDAVGPDGSPTQLIPFDELEADYNRLSGRSDDRVAVWPTSVLAQDDGSATVFYREVVVSPGALNLRVLGSGIATVPPGGTTAVRDPTVLFHAPEPVFSSGAVRAGGFVYLYGCRRIDGPRFGCRVARAPEADIHDRSAYEFWDGSTWSDDANDAAFSLEGPSGGPSVSWNPWLGRYLAVYTLGLTNRVMMRTAERPQGPWSEATLAFVGAPTTGSTVNYAAFEHPELSRDGGRIVTISYFHPLGPFRGELRLLEIRFA